MLMAEAVAGGHAVELMGGRSQVVFFEWSADRIVGFRIDRQMASWQPQAEIALTNPTADG